MQGALESALAELTLGPEIESSDGPRIAAWLERNQVEPEDAQALTRDFARLQVYRTLVRGNLREALRASMPRTVARLGASFEPYFEEFLRVAPPVSRYLRELTPRFLDFALARWAVDSALPAYISDLARHEALQIEIASLLARPKDNLAAELGVDESVEFIDAVRLVRYEWAVHRLPDDEASFALPERSAVSLLVYRSPEHDVRYLELGPFATALLAGLLAERLSLRAALGNAARDVGLRLDEELLNRAARLLAELAERGALLGKVRPRAEATSRPGNFLTKVIIPV